MERDPMIRCIRAICARELNSDFEFPFFWSGYMPEETPDQAIMRMFKAEREHQDTDFDTVLVLCHG